VIEHQTASPPASLLSVRAAGRPTDEDLVGAVREGDDRAFERLYARYHRRIAAYVQGMVQDHAKSEDITQEVFVSALRRMRDTDRAITFKPWIYEIAKNACIDAFRRARRATLVSLDADGDGCDAIEGRRLAGREPTPDVAVDRKLELETLTGAFGGLTETHHQILVMRELEGLSYKEIGDRLGMTRPSVESTLFRARRRLEEEYAELLSGERCRRIQGILAERAGTRLGVRDEKRMARHVSYCQPCRRAAVAAGLDVAALSPRPVRTRIAAWLPLPLVLRRWVAGDSGVSALGGAAHYAEPLSGGWAKAGAAFATLALAGVGTGAITNAGPLHLRGGHASADLGAQRQAADGTTATGSAPAGATTGAHAGATVAPAAMAPDRRPARRGGAGATQGSGPASGAKDGGPGTPAGAAAGVVASATAAAGNTASGTTNVTQQATGPGPLVPKVIHSVAAPVSAGSVTKPVTDVVPTVTKSVQGAVDQVAPAVAGDGSKPAADGTLKPVTDTVSGLVGGG
jgi:RNA polymerase sigma factor (sigma-70 family)